jgi:hypothetical protein
VVADADTTTRCARAGYPGIRAHQDFPPLVWGEHTPGRIEWVDGATAGASADASAGHCVGSGCGPLSQLTSAVSEQGMLLPGGIRGGCAYASGLTVVNHPMPATAAPIAATCLILANMNLLKLGRGWPYYLHSAPRAFRIGAFWPAGSAQHTPGTPFSYCLTIRTAIASISSDRTIRTTTTPALSSLCTCR